MKQVVIQYGERFVAGFSIKTNRVYTTAYTSEAKRFSAVGAQEFIAEYTKIDPHFSYDKLILHLVRRGEKFNPYPDDAQVN